MYISMYSTHYYPVKQFFFFYPEWNRITRYCNEFDIINFESNLDKQTVVCPSWNFSLKKVCKSIGLVTLHFITWYPGSSPICFVIYASGVPYMWKRLAIQWYPSFIHSVFCGSTECGMTVLIKILLLYMTFLYTLVGLIEVHMCILKLFLLASLLSISRTLWGLKL